MEKRRGISKTGVIIGVVIAAAAALAVMVVLRTDTTGKGGSGLSESFTYDLGQLPRIDPSLILYKEAIRIETGFKEAARGVAVGDEDRVYVAGDRAVAVFDAGGRRVRQIDLDEPPRCLAVAADGTVYVGMIDHVEVYSAEGDRRAKWESLGDKAIVTSVTVSGADVFVADSGGRVVLRYDTAGRLLGRIGRADRSRNIPGLLVRRPCVDVVVEKGEVLWVTNPGRWRVEAYTFDGDLKFWWGKYSPDDIEGFCGCCNPTDIAILPGGGFVTSEKGLPRVKVYDERSNFTGVVAGPELFEKGTIGLDLAVDSAGRILVLDPVAKKVRVFVRKQADTTPIGNGRE